ncbi:MAG: hypothetical protein COA49_08705, partial [Bacteroidetes bacterium]
MKFELSFHPINASKNKRTMSRTFKFILVATCCCSILFGTKAQAQYSLTVEASVPAAAAGTTYRFYIDMTDPTDRMSAIFGNDQSTLELN